VKREIRNKSILPDFPPETELDRQIESGEFFQKHKGGERRRRRKHREPTEEAVAEPEADAPAQADAVGSALDLAREIAERKRGVNE
jgi:hypothetical protein